MKIRYTRSGGVGNIRTHVEIDSAKLPKNKREQLHKLISAARVFQEPSRAPASSVPDDLDHELEIEEDGRAHHLKRSDSNSTPQLRQLFDHLQQHLKP